MKEFTTALLGNQTLPHFLALLFFALLAATLSLLLQTTSRDVSSSNTPRHFDWIFLIADNYKRALTSLILICISLRFAPELFGVEISEFWALVIGFTHDKLAQIIKDKTSLLGQKKQS